MIELSKLYGLDIYTSQGKYVGRVQDVVINLKKGKVSVIMANPRSPEKKTVGIKDVLKTSIKIVPDEKETYVNDNEIINIDYDRVKAVGDIIIISPSEKTEKPRVI
ncbi:PRC-barrel domain protein [Methanothermus fervidus DSM 2088]|uniref:PRC-barrel domain protein n=1 Tax=Methanothermus fervidus (strain ATCC 43054 / DSM 2088 / JCM 10308 / V24 S) TaxID=523846 RepID=E3GWN4_METFV|nr:PRC-barrel domain-containing protein [Methanothermus fervidus]ADP76848.1 PRC-barrel domain protein [Methanothermus fervidus DSM 2088]